MPLSPRQQPRCCPRELLTDLTGQAREFRDASSNLAFVFVLALAFIYLVLSAQFESFRDPLMIMVTVPLSMTGALTALWLTGGTLNVYSQIGLVTLIGLITKHGILIVEFTNRLQDEGRERRSAIIEAAALRLRPILMTTAAMILGAVPLALADRCGCRKPAADRLGHRRRHGTRHDPDALRGPLHLRRHGVQAKIRGHARGRNGYGLTPETKRPQPSSPAAASNVDPRRGSAVLDHADDGGQDGATGAARDQVGDQAADIKSGRRNGIGRYCAAGHALDDLAKHHAADGASNRVAAAAEAFALHGRAGRIAADRARDQLNDDRK